jgi:transposase
MSQKRYPADLTDEGWGSLLEPRRPPVKSVARQPRIEVREVAKAMCYMLQSGCFWRNLPQDSPKRQAVYSCFREMEENGTRQRLKTVLPCRIRTKQGRDDERGAGDLDCHSVKTTEKGELAILTRVRR